MEILIVGAIFLFALFYNQGVSSKKFIQDNKLLFDKLKEEDFDFLVSVRYGDKKTPEEVFDKRIKTAGIVMLAFMFIYLIYL